jgi:hypothetical protein
LLLESYPIKNSGLSHGPNSGNFCFALRWLFSSFVTDSKNLLQQQLFQGVPSKWYNSQLCDVGKNNATPRIGDKIPLFQQN